MVFYDVAVIWGNHNPMNTYSVKMFEMLDTFTPKATQSGQNNHFYFGSLIFPYYINISFN